MWEGRIQNIQVVFPKQILGLLSFLRAKRGNLLSRTALQSLLILFQILLAMKQLNPNQKTLLITQVLSILIVQADLFNGLVVVVIKLTIFQILTIIKGQNYFPKEKGLHPKQNFLICIFFKFLEELKLKIPIKQSHFEHTLINSQDQEFCLANTQTHVRKPQPIGSAPQGRQLLSILAAPRSSCVSSCRATRVPRGS